MLRPHMGHHQATLTTWGDHCTALHTLSFVPIDTSLLLLLICFIRYFYPIFLSSHFTVIYVGKSISKLQMDIEPKKIRVLI
jgi:hypothetical protein